MSNEFDPCPRCGSEDVEWSNCRDLNIHDSFVSCESCDLRTFRVEDIAFMTLPNKDYESAVMKYNAWCKTNPISYCEERWENK